MPIEECPHCFTKMLYGSNTICTSCQKDKNAPAEMSKFEYEKKCAEENHRAVIHNLTRRCCSLLVAGVLLMIAYIVTIIASLYSGFTSGFFAYLLWAAIGGFIGGFKDLYTISKIKKERLLISKG